MKDALLATLMRLRRWAVAGALAALVVLILLPILPEDIESSPVFIVAAWDGTVVPFLISPWRIIRRSDFRATEQRAVREDPGKKAVEVVIPVLSSIVALVAVAGLTVQAEKLAWPYLLLFVLLGGFAVASAWALVHTAFALYYRSAGRALAGVSLRRGSLRRLPAQVLVRVSAPREGSALVMIHPQEALLQEARAFQQSEAFAPYGKLRQAAEHRLARLMQLGVRQARYFGRTKTCFQLLMAATVANLTLVS
jgi:hypothetical protein